MTDFERLQEEQARNDILEDQLTQLRTETLELAQAASAFQGTAEKLDYLAWHWAQDRLAEAQKQPAISKLLEGKDGT